MDGNGNRGSALVFFLTGLGTRNRGVAGSNPAFESGDAFSSNLSNPFSINHFARVSRP